MPFSELLALIERVFQMKLFEINKTPITFVSIIMFVIVIGGFGLLARFISRVVLARILLRFARCRTSRSSCLIPSSSPPR